MADLWYVAELVMKIIVRCAKDYKNVNFGWEGYGKRAEKTLGEAMINY